MSAKKEVLEDVGAGKGHLSTVQLVFEEKYGGNVILKVPGAEMSKNILSIRDERFEALHNTEVDVYSILDNHNHPDSDERILYPKIHHSEKMNIHSDPVVEGHLVMEYIPRITHLFIEDNLKPEELVEAVKNIARLHGMSSDLTEAERKKVPRDFFSGWFVELFTEKNVALFMRVWEATMSEWMTTQKSKEAIGFLRNILRKDIMEKLNDDCQISGVEEVLCHGDYCSHNVLFENLPDGTFKFRAICDFQGANWGNAAQDLTRLFVTALSGKDRRDHGKRLLKVYYDELNRVTKGDVPFSWEQLTQSYTRFLPHHAAVVCVTTPGKFLRKMTEMKEGVEKEEYRNNMLEKYVALMEDLNDAWKEAWIR